MSTQYKYGYKLGTGAALSVELGFVPAKVKVTNLTDGDIMTEAVLGRKLIPFTSGGTLAIVAGMELKGATSGAKAIIAEVLLVSGSFAGGDAAGFFVVEEGGITGTFASENVYCSSDTTSGVDDATVTVQVEKSVKTDTAVASVTGNDAITSYVGSQASAAKGFTIGSNVSESGKLLYWEAWR